MSKDTEQQHLEDWVEVDQDAALDEFDAFEANRIAIRRHRAYDDSYLRTDLAFVSEPIPDGFLQRFIAGVNQDIETLAEAAVTWRTPIVMTFETRHLDPELLEILCGQPVVPLCLLPIPAEGQE